MDSKYFNESEQVCHCCGQGADIINPLLLEQLDKLRAMWGGPIWASCMYRCYEHNLAVGSFPGSQHELGNAADIYVDGDYEEFYELVLESQLFDGVGYYPEDEFVHVDVRDDCTAPNDYLW